VRAASERSNWDLISMNSRARPLMEMSPEPVMKTMEIAAAELLLQAQTIYSWQLYIDYEAAGNF